jgi:hypothetical protein
MRARNFVAGGLYSCALALGFEKMERNLSQKVLLRPSSLVPPASRRLRAASGAEPSFPSCCRACVLRLVGGGGGEYNSIRTRATRVPWRATLTTCSRAVPTGTPPPPTAPCAWRVHALQGGARLTPTGLAAASRWVGSMK